MILLEKSDVGGRDREVEQGKVRVLEQPSEEGALKEIHFEYTGSSSDYFSGVGGGEYVGRQTIE